MLAVAFFARHQDRHRPVFLSGGNDVAAAEHLHDVGRVRARRHVEVVRLAAEQQIANRAADQPGLEAGAAQLLAYAHDVRRDGVGPEHLSPLLR